MPQQRKSKFLLSRSNSLHRHDMFPLCTVPFHPKSERYGHVNYSRVRNIFGAKICFRVFSGSKITDNFFFPDKIQKAADIVMIVRLPVVSTFDCECGLMLSSCNCPFGIRQISKRAGTYPFLCSILEPSDLLFNTFRYCFVQIQSLYAAFQR